MTGRRGRRIASAVAIFLTAIALQRACTQSWGRAAAPDGTTYELSAVGLSRRGPSSDAARTDCRWWPRYGDAALCAPPLDGARAHDALRRGYPMLQVALWLAVASVLLQALRVPRQRLLQVAVPASSCALIVTAIVFMSRGAAGGLAALSGIPVDFSSEGYLGAIAAAILSGASTLLLAESFPSRHEDPVATNA